MISIITPSFNRAYIIDETAQSIFNQSNNNWEWIIVDDGSTDESWEKLQSYASKDSRVRVFQRDREPKGACTCRNIGTEKAQGEFLIFLDTDDLLGNKAIENRLAQADQAQAAVPFFPTVTFENDPSNGFLWDDSNHPVSWLTGLFTMTPPCQGTAPLWRTSDFVSVGGWREDLQVWQDVELHIRAYAKGLRFKAVEAAMPDVFLRLSPESISHVNFHSPEKAASRWLVVQYVLDHFKPHDLSREETSALQTMILSVYQNALALRDFGFAKRISQYADAAATLTTDQLAWCKLALLHQRLRLYKIPALQKHLIKARESAFSLKLNRKLGSQIWKIFLALLNWNR